MASISMVEVAWDENNCICGSVRCSTTSWQVDYPLVRRDSKVTAEIPKIKDTPVEFKFIINGNWRCSPRYGITDPNSAFCNNVLA